MSEMLVKDAQEMGEVKGYNHHGQKIGSKGERTRRLLIDTTVKLLETQGLRDVSVMDVARAARTSPATFYVYFRGVPEVVLAALEDARQCSPEIEEMVEGDWMGEDAFALSRRFVEVYTELWNRNRTIFLVRNLAAEEGDARFLNARNSASAGTLQMLARQVEKAQAAGRTPAHLRPSACAGTILMMLERLAATGASHHRDAQAVTYATLKDAAAYTVAFMLGARA